MYSIVVHVQVTPGMLAEYDAFSERYLEHCKQVPDLLNVFHQEDLSHPGRFVVSTTLQNRKAAQAWARSPALKAILQEMGPNLLTIVGDVEAWVPVAGATPSEGAQPTFSTVTLLTINSKPGSSDAFEELGRAAVARFEQHGRGLASAWLVRLAGGRSRYAFVLNFLSAADARATFAVPEIARLVQEDAMRPYVAGEYATEWHDVVRVLVRQPAVTG
jgi:quinol monooxygenase YgiN